MNTPGERAHREFRPRRTRDLRRLRLPSLCLVFAALLPVTFAATTPTSADATKVTASPTSPGWQHPLETYPRSIRRWFADLPAELQYSAVRYRHGDEPAWAEKDCDDSHWEERGVWNLPARSGVEWVRFRVRMGAGAHRPLPAGIMISTVRAYELFWDGVPLGHSGVPGNSAAAERPGQLDETFAIPPNLRGPGEHVVALRTSSHRCGFPAPNSGFRFVLDAPTALQGKVLQEAFLPTLAAGALFMIGLASLIMWMLAARRVTLLLLCGVCLFGAAMQALQAVRWFFPYPADWHYPVLATMAALVAGQGLLTVALVLAQFQVPHRRLLIGLLVPLIAIAFWLSPARMNLEGVWVLGISMSVACGAAIWAVRRERRGAWPVLLGVAASGLLLAFQAEDYRATFFVKFLPALVGVIAALALQLHEERRHAKAAQLAAARLETELLKKNLQPHFLLNTLAVLTEIVEQDPRSAVRLIDDLADEFRSVARVSAEKLISLGQELELCRAHLRVMSVRTARTWHLETAGADETTAVPPAVFLTLIENGFAHQTPRGSNPTFRLTMERTSDGARRFLFFSPGELQPRTNRAEGGTGLRYVRARLEESFPGEWTFTDGPAPGGWRTVIEIRSREATAVRPLAAT